MTMDGEVLAKIHVSSPSVRAINRQKINLQCNTTSDIHPPPYLQASTYHSPSTRSSANTPKPCGCNTAATMMQGTGSIRVVLSPDNTKRGHVPNPFPTHHQPTAN